MESVFKLGVIFRVVDRFSGPFRRMGAMLDNNRDKLRRLGQSFRTFGKQALVAGGVAAAAAFAPAHAFGNFEAEMAAVGAASSATAKDMRLLTKEAIRIGIETEHSPQAAAEGFRALASAGLNAREQLAAIRPSLVFATAGQIDVGRASETTVSALKAFGLQAGESQRVVDVLTKATNVSMLKAGEFQLALGNLGLEGPASNQKFEAMVATLGALRSTGLTAENAAEKIKMTLTALRAPTDEARKLMGKFGIVTRDAQGKMLPFAGIVDNMRSKLSRLPRELQDQYAAAILGRDAMLAYQGALRATFTDVTTGKIFKGTAALREMERQLLASKGTAKTFADKFLATFKGLEKLLTGSVQTLVLVFGKFTAKAFAPFVKWATQALNKVIEWVQKNPELAQKIATFTVAVAGLAFVVGGLAVAAGVVMGALALLGGPVTLIIAGIALLGVGVAALVVWWDDLTAAMKRAWEMFKQLPFVRGGGLAFDALAGLAPGNTGLPDLGPAGSEADRALEAARGGAAFPEAVANLARQLRETDITGAPLPGESRRSDGRSDGRAEAALAQLRGGTTIRIENISLPNATDGRSVIEELEFLARGLVTAEQ